MVLMMIIIMMQLKATPCCPASALKILGAPLGAVLIGLEVLGSSGNIIMITERITQ